MLACNSTQLVCRRFYNLVPVVASEKMYSYPVKNAKIDKLFRSEPTLIDVNQRNFQFILKTRHAAVSKLGYLTADTIHEESDKLGLAMDDVLSLQWRHRYNFYLAAFNQNYVGSLN